MGLLFASTQPIYAQESPTFEKIRDVSPDGKFAVRISCSSEPEDPDKIERDLITAVKADPQNDAPYYNRAQAKRLKNDTAGAIADYTRAIELGFTNPAAYNNRGNARAENKDRDAAIADYTRAIELKPDYARAYYNRAALKKEKGMRLGLPQISNAPECWTRI